MSKLTATKVAQALDISVPTLNNWYRWYLDKDIEKPKNTPILPMYTQTSLRGVRYWDSEDLPALKKFKKWIPRGRAGVMGEYTARFWGKRGERAMKNRGTKNS